MMHTHSQSHVHGDIQVQNNKAKRAFFIGILLNSLFVIAEFIGGQYTKSAALLADAGHNLMDVVTLLFALLALYLISAKPTKNYTYGYRKLTILVSFLNASSLIIVAIGLCMETIEHLTNLLSISGKAVAWVAFVGILINSLTALLFRNSAKQDLNLQGAYLHLVMDALVSVSVVISGLLISYTSYYWIDAVFGLTIIGLILFSSWKLFKESIKFVLDGVPTNISINQIIKQADGIEGIRDIHHVHLWPISTNELALTAHISYEENMPIHQSETPINELRHRLEHLNISHITLESEFESCATEMCSVPK